MRDWVTTETSVVLAIATIAITAKSVVMKSDRERQDVGLDDLEQRGVGVGEGLDRRRPARP